MKMMQIVAPTSNNWARLPGSSDGSAAPDGRGTIACAITAILSRAGTCGISHTRRTIWNGLAGLGSPVAASGAAGSTRGGLEGRKRRRRGGVEAGPTDHTS